MPAVAPSRVNQSDKPAEPAPPPSNPGLPFRLLLQKPHTKELAPHCMRPVYEFLIGQERKALEVKVTSTKRSRGIRDTSRDSVSRWAVRPTAGLGGEAEQWKAG